MNPLLRLMALGTLAAAQEHATSSPRTPLESSDVAPLLRNPFPPQLVIMPRKPRYACPKCGATADTPKRCRPCGVKMARTRRTDV